MTRLSAAVDGESLHAAELRGHCFTSGKCRQQEVVDSTTGAGEAISWCKEEVGRGEVALYDLTPLFFS